METNLHQYSFHVNYIELIKLLWYPRFMDKKEIAPIIIGKLMNIGGMLEKNANQILMPFNLNQHQFSILFSINQAGKVQQKNMVNKLLLEKAHVSKIVKKLSNMGLVEITKDDVDKRSYWLTITEKGNETVEKCMAIMCDWHDKWVNEIDIEKLMQILDNLAIVQNIFRDITTK